MDSKSSLEEAELLGVCATVVLWTTKPLTKKKGMRITALKSESISVCEFKLDEFFGHLNDLIKTSTTPPN